MALLEENLVLFVVNLENLLKESVELVGIGRGPSAGEGGVSIHHGGGGKGVATELDGLAKCVAPELVLAGVKGEGRRAHGELERGEGERERQREGGGRERKKRIKIMIISQVHRNQLHIYANNKTHSIWYNVYCKPKINNDKPNTGKIHEYNTTLQVYFTCFLALMLKMFSSSLTENLPSLHISSTSCLSPTVSTNH